VSPSPTPSGTVFFRGFLFTCSVRYVNFWFFSLPRFSCVRN
jgi:hypothetical protein